MSFFSLIIRSFKYYFKGHFTVALGIAITTAIITGALIVGDSVKYSLEQTTRYRLGEITHAVNTGERYITQSLGSKISDKTDLKTSAVLKLKASGFVSGGEYRLKDIQVWGIDDNFTDLVGTSFPYDSIPNGEIIVSENLASRLMLEKGDMLLLRINKASAIPLNTPFVSEENQTVSRRFKIFDIAGKTDFGRLNLKISQTAPFNVFIPIRQLNSLMEMNNKANLVLVAGNNPNNDEISLRKSIQESYTIKDANINLQSLENQEQWEITSERVFIDDTITSAINNEIQRAIPILTYFVNEISIDGRSTPYSFVSSLNDSSLKRDEIILNDWTAEDLNAGKGDTVTLTYYVIGPLRQLTSKSNRFTVKDIVPIQGRYGDRTLMPHLPGLSDAGNCRDWNTGIPIDLNKIRDKDEDYWDEYRGTPKAFINLDKAVDLWRNRYGSYTAFRFHDQSTSSREIQTSLNQAINPFSLGIQIQPVKKEGLEAARQGVDFSQLFLGLSFFILISGIILTALLFIFNLEKRFSQITTLSALGYRDRTITTIILAENIFVALIGGVTGVLLSLLYNKLVFMGLNQVWQEIVRTNVLEISVQPLTLLTGLGISLMVSLLTITIVLRRKLTKQNSKIRKKRGNVINPRIDQLLSASLIVLPLISLGIVLMQIIKGQYNEPAWFFTAGGLLLIFTVILTFYLFDKYDRTNAQSFNLNALSLKNLIRNRTRSLTVILLLSLGTFIVISTGANRKNIFAGSGDKSSGTGGYLFYSESTVPVLKNLQVDSVRRSFALDTNFKMVQFRVHEGDDASCLNLNRVSNPRILGVNPQDLSSRFSFLTGTKHLDENNPWHSLSKDLDGVVPAIADQTVIKWGLGKEVGDTLIYQNQAGEKIPVKLIGGLAASVFQGNIIISNDNFIKHFPQISGSNVFLIDGNPENQASIAENLNLVFRDYGWQMTPAVQRLAEFMSVTNTYLSIFLVLGAFGLLLGTIGLAIVLARSILQRSDEIALLLAAGYSFGQVFRLLFREYFLLMVLGIAGGGLSAIIAVLPGFVSGQQNISAGFILLLISIITLNGIIWIGIITYSRLRKLQIVESLKNE